MAKINRDCQLKQHTPNLYNCPPSLQCNDISAENIQIQLTGELCDTAIVQRSTPLSTATALQKGFEIIISPATCATNTPEWVPCRPVLPPQG
jgi:hypothetical protein